ncbi:MULTISPECIES: Rieske 2Fe-2S domain-containing protein [unclassified Beijerinckia]|uniref:aromatic ring-hydroxylating oxygenase subunit alpha n=1 Tax=unclassified Beijerinckia TaxID=2638183 RepID=UPI0008999821|nr:MULTISPECIES: Rieske 2Fe-2S domain-containing protein [unclassified Beijerinckia]MDH7799267.1 anthranilate 1,2-dioxygenase large subunit [Beijerinckia sp. GAS462]SED90176.1 anthranilate 1,2-dioxygenase large subunit [Beijerinckia sp. 28-YEA-48]
MTDTQQLHSFPKPDYSRIPFAFYHDPEIYEIEQKRIFQGPLWQFIGLEAEIPQVGDFRTTYLGDLPIVYNRGRDGSVYAFVNRCSHRGALVCREKFGNERAHTCVYHRWSFDLEGNLTTVAFQNGIEGKGGMPPEFKRKDHNLQKLKVASLNGALFASFRDDVEPLEQYLGTFMVAHLKGLFKEPVKVLGYQRQRVKGNWKLYTDNLRDNYHGPLLHEFQRTFGVSRSTQDGGSRMDPRHRHHLTYSTEGTDNADITARSFAEADAKMDRLKLSDPSILSFTPEADDGLTLAIASFFPNAAFQRMRNTMATRQVRTRGVGEFELFWTFFGYTSDTPEMTETRLRQSNYVGPSGYVSMEDGEVIENVQLASRSAFDRASVVEVGGNGPIEDKLFRVNDVAIRGFWSYYAELMDMEPPGAEK